MSKISVPISNDYCPQTLFLYGTYGENGEPDFGLFCWFSYLWDRELGVMACIGGEKLTRERIHQNKIFSANLVTENILPLADYFGNTDGYSKEKMQIDVSMEKGHRLNVPILADSPLAFELEVKQFIPLEDGEVMLCKIHNVLVDGKLADPSVSTDEKMAAIAPVCTTCTTYFGWDGKKLGAWGEIERP